MLDSSAAVDFLARQGPGKWVDEHLLAYGDVHAPYLLDVEFLGGLRKLVARGLSTAVADLARADFMRLKVLRYPHPPFLGRIWELRHNVTPYDAAYVALAEALDAPLLTTDRRLARTPGLPVEVIAPPA